MIENSEIQRLAGLEEDQLFAEVIQYGNLPEHIALIMDGNGRWAKKRFLPRLAGHRAGRHSVRQCTVACARIGVKVLTLYTFSQENFNRPNAEVNALWRFLQESLLGEIEELKRQNVRLTATGDMSLLPDKASSALNAAIESLSVNDGITLNLALAYGGRQEIVHAALALAKRLATGELTESEVDEQAFGAGLYQPSLPDPDLVIRTSGESRLSNFLLWQTAYSEILITPVLWPDFKQRDLALAVADYQRRERRFGGLSPFGEEHNESKPDSALDVGRWKRLLGKKS